MTRLAPKRGRPPIAGGESARLVAAVPAETKAELERHAAAQGRSTAELVRDAVDRYVRMLRRRSA